MPIKNLTDNVIPSFGVIGKLRKGGEKIEIKVEGKTRFKYGEDLDHWRFTSDRPEVEAAFTNAFGEKPRNIKVFIPHATPEEAFSTWCEVWSATSLQHRCDGETAFIWLENGKYKRGSKPCPGGHKDGDPLNDAVGRLNVIIPELVQAGYVGYVTMETHGKHDILSISKSLQAVYESRRDNPLGLRGVMFDLRRVQEEVSTPGFGAQAEAGKRSKVKKWNVKLEPAADWVRLQLEMAHNQTMMLDEPMKQLPEGDIIDGSSTEKSPAKDQKEKYPYPANDPIVELNAIGQALWHDKWPDAKRAVFESAEISGDVDNALEWIKKREKSLSNDKNLSAHIAKSWPGMERTLPIIKKLFPKSKPIDIIAGIVQAAATKAIKPELSDQDLADIALIVIQDDSDFTKVYWERASQGQETSI